MQAAPFSQACENNKAPILAHLKMAYANADNVLEVGSGTGQHAVFFAPQLPHLIWQTSDLPENHAGINAWIDNHTAENLCRPLVLNADEPGWPQAAFDGIFTANTLHIMAWSSVINLFENLGKTAAESATLVIYGPFKYNGQFTSDSNGQFDLWLKQQAPHRGIRDFEQVSELAGKQGFSLLADHAMPANNQLLIWQR